jgi:acylphosphatase
MKTVNLIVKGKVQGVGYRESTKQKALSLGLTGTVENLRNGDVHILVTGNETALSEFVNWCYHGSQLAVVTAVLQDEVALKQFDGFTIERSH